MFKIYTIIFVLFLFVPRPVLACEACNENKNTHLSRNVHAPIAVMGDHMHEVGEVMISYRSMIMQMQGNKLGTRDISPQQILEIPNVHAPPADLRVVPTEMQSHMHMLGAMFGIKDWLTLTAMGMVIEREMEHLTFGAMSGDLLGSFTTRSSGVGDIRMTGLIRLYQNAVHHLHLQSGLSLPTGSINEADDVLTPMNTRKRMRLPYAMQLGSGTIDARPGLTYTGETPRWNWGAQYQAVIPLQAENGEGYRWGDHHTINLWGGYQWTAWLNTQIHLKGETMAEIEGRDLRIKAPVQTADPENYGGEWITAGLGFHITPKSPLFKGQYFSLEATVPLYQDLNGPQMKRDWGMTAGWTLSF